MNTKEFHLNECSNVKDVLAETLRYKYGREGSREFFEECEARRDFIEQEIESTSPDDNNTLATNISLLTGLSALISRIERSSLGEYSWPFVEELKKIAAVICTEKTILGDNTPPKVYVFSDGGLDAYRIYPERKRPTASTIRILTIVFPRTLKHFVLLHPILGHEIGHAIWRISKHERDLKKIVHDELISAGGKFEDQAATANWIYQQNPPADTQNLLSDLNSMGINEGNFFDNWANWLAWIEEILCDLVGLLSFGPSFVAAHSQLLYALCPSGAMFGPVHPPVGGRVNMVLRAAEILGYDDTSKFPDGGTKNAVDNFWTQQHAKRQNNDWFDIFTDEQLTKVLNRLGALLGNYDPTQYPEHTPELVDDLYIKILNHVPPVGFRTNETTGGDCYKVDFRHILYAGWIAEHNDKKMPFLKLNRLCEHAIMQQCGIDKFLEAKKTPEGPEEDVSAVS